MILESDIRIGNYVSYFDYNMEETAFIVEGILEGYIYNSGLPLSKLPLEKTNPVVLDLYLLRKFGFIKGEKEYGEDETPALQSGRIEPNRRRNFLIVGRTRSDRNPFSVRFS